MSDELQTNLRAISVADAVRLGETYPSVPLRILFLELSHAEQVVPIGADDRAEVVASTIRGRLTESGHLRSSEDRHALPDGSTTRFSSRRSLLRR
jgi:hypothetical protein